jgi:hypothetical protein
MGGVTPETEDGAPERQLRRMVSGRGQRRGGNGRLRRGVDRERRGQHGRSSGEFDCAQSCIRMASTIAGVFLSERERS